MVGCSPLLLLKHILLDIALRTQGNTNVMYLSQKKILTHKRCCKIYLLCFFKRTGFTGKIVNLTGLRVLRIYSTCFVYNIRFYPVINQCQFRILIYVFFVMG